MKGPCHYGRYDDDPQHVGCPRAKSDMTPCIARDGHTALSDPPLSVCVGCGSFPDRLLAELEEAYEPARRIRPSGDPAKCADQLTKIVREATAPPSPA